MPNQFTMKDDIERNDKKDNSKSIVNVKWSKLSERVIPVTRMTIFRRIHSEIQIESNVNYDDLCGPWIYPENPHYAQYVKPPHPTLYLWKFITVDDVIYLKKNQENKETIHFFFENKLLDQNIGKNSNILAKLLWEFFKFARLHLFSEKCISGFLGIIYLTHLFFLSHPWQTTTEVYQFFYKTVLLHVVLDPPENLEIFTATECKLLFKAFHEIYIKNLVLLYIICHPHYHFAINLHNLTSLA